MNRQASSCRSARWARRAGEPAIHLLLREGRPHLLAVADRLQPFHRPTTPATGSRIVMTNPHSCFRARSGRAGRRSPRPSHGTPKPGSMGSRSANRANGYFRVVRVPERTETCERTAIVPLRIGRGARPRRRVGDERTRGAHRTFFPRLDPPPPLTAIPECTPAKKMRRLGSVRADLGATRSAAVSGPCTAVRIERIDCSRWSLGRSSPSGRGEAGGSVVAVESTTSAGSELERGRAG